METLEFEVTDGSASAHTSTLNLDKSSGVTTVKVKNFASTNTAEDTIELTGVTTSTSLTITDELSTGNRDNNFTVTYSGVSGSADKAAVTINSTTSAATLGNITVAGIEDLTVSSVGGADATYKVTGAAATKLTLNASAKSGGQADVVAADVADLVITAADDFAVVDSTTAMAKVRNVSIDVAKDATVTAVDLTPTMDDAKAETVKFTVTGAGKAVVDVDANFGTQSDTNADTFEVAASGNSGGVTVDAAGFTSNAPRTLKITGGSGNDAVTVGATGLDKYDTIALGAGTADTVTVGVTYASAAGTKANLFYTDSLTGADLPTITGVEVARLNIAGTAAANTIAVKSAGFASTLELNAATAATTGADVDNNNLTITDIKAGQIVKFGSNLDLDQSTITLEVAGASTNTADVLAIQLDGKNQTATATFEGFTAANVESVSVDLASTNASNTTIAAGALTFADATSVTLTGSKITSATVDAKDGATIDASAMTGTLELTAATADKYTLKGSSTKATKFIMSTGLDNGDTIVAGSATTDSLTATINGLTATTGALKISGVETLSLTGSSNASTINLSGVTGAKEIQVAGSVNQSFTNVGAGTAFRLDDGAATANSFTGTLAIALASSSGTSDSVDVFLTADSSSPGTATLSGTGIETLNLKGTENAWTAGKLNVNAFSATTITITGVDTSSPATLDLRGTGSPGTVQLNAATTTVDASAFDGAVAAIAATNTATTFKAKAASTFTGSAVNDTVVIGTAASAISGASATEIGTLDGGSGNDSLTVFAGKNASLTSVTGFETVTVNLKAEGADYSIVALDGLVGGSAGASTLPEGIQTVATTVLTGGEAGYVVTLAGDATTDYIGDNGARTIDASAVLGSVAMTFGSNALSQTNLSDQIVIRGGQGSKDKVVAIAAGNNANLATGEFTMTGVETLVISSNYDTTNASGANTVDLKNVTGLITAAAFSGTSAVDDVAFTNVKAGTVFEVGQAISGGEMVGALTIGLADATGTTDAVTVKLIDTDGSNGSDAANVITADGVENLTLELIGDGASSSGEDHIIEVVNSNTNASKITVVAADTDTSLTLSSIASSITTIDASAAKSTVSIAASARGSSAMTITTGEGNDSVAMENAADVLDGGTKTSDNDTLNISFTGTGGALIVDLSSSTDQIQMFNGLANASVQKNFESLNASAYVQTNSVGADITDSSAANTITGTAYADTIRLTNGGSDTVKFLASNGSDTIVGGKSGATASGGDVFDFSAISGVTALLDAGSTASDTIEETASTATGVALGGKVVFIDTDHAANFSTLQSRILAASDSDANTSEWLLADSAKSIVFYGDMDSTSTDIAVYLVTGVNGGTDTFTQIASLVGVDATAFVSANFVLAAS